MLRFSSPVTFRHTVKQSSIVLRRLSFIHELRPRSVILDKSKHKIIYEFPYILPVSYTIKTKFWIPALATVVAPVGFLMHEFSAVVIGCLIPSCLHGALVHLISKFAGNTIGKIYINKESESADIIISAVDKNGNRIDRFHKPSDLIVCDYSSRWSYSMGFIKIGVQNANVVYQLNVINFKVYDRKSFTSLFGDRWTFKDNEEKGV